MKTLTFNPDWHSKAGDTIADILDERNISHTQFAELINESTDFVNQLIETDFVITADLAEKLSQVLGSTVSFWLAR
jgi:plasmid maintenance system antidote protein VapI